MKNTLNPLKEIGFEDFEKVEPEDLLVFGQEYLDLLPSMKRFVKDNLGKIVSIPTARINGNGSCSRMIIIGRLFKMNDNSFSIFTKKDYYGVRDRSFELMIRFDNVMGIIPLHKNYPQMNPLAVNKKVFSAYFESLQKMRKLLVECVGTKHAATLYYRYTKDKPNFRDGNYRVDCEVLEVNKSNIKFKHFRTYAYINPNNKYVDLNPGEDFDRFIAPDRYLKKVAVNFSYAHKIDYHDYE